METSGGGSAAIQSKLAFKPVARVAAAAAPPPADAGGASSSSAQTEHTSITLPPSPTAESTPKRQRRQSAPRPMPPLEAMVRLTHVQCCVHNQIEIEPVCRAVLDTPQFQRLKGLKQLGCCHYVFPGATHTRFEHSIGVAHMAGELVRRLVNKCNDDLRSYGVTVTEVDRLCVKLAGLCHDLGHGPYSHLFEHVVETMRPEAHWTHEHASLQLLDHLLAENGLGNLEAFGMCEQDMVFVKECIVGSGLQPGCAAGSGYQGRPRNKWFLYDIVNNAASGLDVDKLDYFQRDAHYTIGGIQNFERLMELARVAPNNDPYRGHGDEEAEAGGGGMVGGALSASGGAAAAAAAAERERPLCICFPEKSVQDAMDVFRTRFTLHQKCYTHKTVKAYEYMTQDMIMLAEPHIRIPGTGGKMCRISEAIDDMQAYTVLKDSIMDIIECSVTPELEPARELIKRMHIRDTYKCVGSSPIKDMMRYDPDANHDWECPAWCTGEADSKGFGVPKSSRELAADLIAALARQRETDAVKAQPPSDRDRDSTSSAGSIEPALFEGERSALAPPETPAPPGHADELSPDDLHVEISKIHFGKRDLNPVDGIRFYKKDARFTDGANKLREEKYEQFLPRKFMDCQVRVFCTSREIEATCRLAFEAWCRQNEGSSPFPALSQTSASQSQSD